MKETIFLTISRYGVQKMTKNLPHVNRGETVVKLSIDMADEAFVPPVLSREVVIEDWRHGIDLADAEFKEAVITEEEAEMIRQRRLEKMEEVLRAQGYEVTRPEPPAEVAE